MDRGRGPAESSSEEDFQFQGSDGTGKDTLAQIKSSHNLEFTYIKAYLMFLTQTTI